MESIQIVSLSYDGILIVNVLQEYFAHFLGEGKKRKNRQTEASFPPSDLFELWKCCMQRFGWISLISNAW